MTFDELFKTPPKELQLAENAWQLIDGTRLKEPKGLRQLWYRSGDIVMEFQQLGHDYSINIGTPANIIYRDRLGTVGPLGMESPVDSALHLAIRTIQNRLRQAWAEIESLNTAVRAMTILPSRLA